MNYVDAKVMFSSANRHLSYEQRSSRNKENVYGNLKFSHSYPTYINTQSQMFADESEDLRHGYLNSSDIFERQGRQSTSTNFGRAGNHMFLNACSQLSGVSNDYDESNLRPQSLSGASMSEVRAILQENCNLLSDKALYHDLINSIDSKLSMSSNAHSVSSATRPVGLTTFGSNRRRGDPMDFGEENTRLFPQFDHQQLGNSRIAAGSQVQNSGLPPSFASSGNKNNAPSNLNRNEFSDKQFYTPIKVLDRLESTSSPAALQKRQSSTPMSKVNSENQSGYIPASAVRNLDVSLSISDISSAHSLGTPLKHFASNQPRGTNVSSCKASSEPICAAPPDALSKKKSSSDVCLSVKKVFDADIGDFCQSKQEPREEGDASESTAAKHVTFRSPSLADVSERSEVVEEDSKATISGPSLESEMTGAIREFLNVPIEEEQFQEHRVDASSGELLSEHSERTLVNVEVDDVPQEPLDSSSDKKRRDRGERTLTGSVLNSGSTERLSSSQTRLAKSYNVMQTSQESSVIATDHYEETAAIGHDSRPRNATAPSEQTGGRHYGDTAPSEQTGGRQYGDATAPSEQTGGRQYGGYTAHQTRSSLARRGGSCAMELKKSLAARHQTLSASLMDTLQNTADLKPLCVELFYALNSERDRRKLADEALEMNRTSTVDLQRAHQMKETARLEHQEATRALREQFESLSSSWNLEKSLLEEERNRLQEEKKVLHEEKQRLQEEWSKVYQEKTLLERKSSKLDGEMIKMQIKTDSAVKKKEVLEREVEVLQFRCSSLQQSLLSLQAELESRHDSNLERISHNHEPLLASKDTVQSLEETQSEKLRVSLLTEELKKERLRGEVLLDNLLIIEERFLLAENEKNHAQKCCEALDYQLKLLMGAANEGLNPHDHNTHSNQGDVKYGQQTSTVSLEVGKFTQPPAAGGEISPTPGSLNVLDDRALEAHTPPLELVAGTSDQVRSVPVYSSLPSDVASPIEKTPAADCFVPAMTSFETSSQSRQMHSYDDEKNQSELNHVYVSLQECEKVVFGACKDHRQLPRLSSSSLESSSSSSGTGDDFSNNDGNQTVRGKYPYSDEFADSTKKQEYQCRKENGDHPDLTSANFREKQNSVFHQPCLSDRGSRSAPEELVEGPRSIPEFRCGRHECPQDKKEGSDNLYRLLSSLRPFDGIEYCGEKTTTEGEKKIYFLPKGISMYENRFRGRAHPTFPTINTEQCSPNIITANDNLLNKLENDFMTSSPSQWNEPLNFCDVVRSSHAQCMAPDFKDARTDVGSSHAQCITPACKDARTDVGSSHAQGITPACKDARTDVGSSHAQCMTPDSKDARTDVGSSHAQCMTPDSEDARTDVGSSHAQCLTPDCKDARLDVGNVHRMQPRTQNASAALMFPHTFSELKKHQQSEKSEEVFVSTASVLIFDGTQVPANTNNSLECHQNSSLGQHPLSEVNDRDVAASKQPVAVTDVSASERKLADSGILSCSLIRELDQEKERLLQELRKLTAFEENTHGKQRKKKKKRSPKRQQQRHEEFISQDDEQVDHHQLLEDYHQRHLHQHRLQQQLQQGEYLQQSNRLSLHNSPRDQFAFAQQEHQRSDLQHLDATTVSSLSFQFDSPTRDTTLEEGLLPVEQSSVHESVRLSSAITHGDPARCPKPRDRISSNDRVHSPLVGGENIGVEKQEERGEGSSDSCPLEAARITLHKINSMSSLMSRAVRNHAANS